MYMKGIYSFYPLLDFSPRASFVLRHLSHWRRNDLKLKRYMLSILALFGLFSIHSKLSGGGLLVVMVLNETAK